MTHRFYLTPFLASTLVSFALLYPADSNAASDARLNCTPMDSEEESGCASCCAFTSATWMRAHTLTTLNVHWYCNGSLQHYANTFQAKACVSYWNADGGDCGTTASNSGYVYCPTGVTLSPSRSVWNSGNYGHFHYIWRTPSNGDSIQFKGIYAYDGG